MSEFDITTSSTSIFNVCVLDVEAAAWDRVVGIKGDIVTPRFR